MEIERRNNIYAILADLFSIDPLTYGQSTDRFHGFACIWEVEDIHGRRDFRASTVTAERFMSILKTGDFPAPPKTPEPVEIPERGYLLARELDQQQQYQYGHAEPLARVLSRAATWLHLDMINRTAYHLVLPDTESVADWRAIARRWLAEKLPPMWRYMIIPYDSFTLRKTDPSKLPTQVGRTDISVDGVGKVISVDYLPSKTRLELLMETDVPTGCVSLSQWHDCSVPKSGNSKFVSLDTTVLLRIGGRLIKPAHDLYFGKYSSNFLDLCVADQLAIASSMVGYTGLNALETAALASGLWAPAAFQAGPFVSKSILHSTSPILLRYILETEENLGLLVDAFRRMKRLDKRSLEERDGMVVFYRWHLPNDQMLQVVDMIRTQTGKPTLKESILCE